MSTLPLVAHRGYASRFPENTLAAYRAAVRAGARFVETDVQISADGIPPLFHDRKLRRLCGASGTGHQRTARELSRLRVRGPRRSGAEKIPTLSAFVRFLQGRPAVRAFVDAGQPRALGRLVLEWILETIVPVRRCILIFDRRASGRAQTPQLPMGAV